MRTTAKLLSAILLSAAMAVSAQATMRPLTHMGCSTCMRAADLEGQQVIGMNGDRLGYVLAVNERGRLVELQTDGGIALTLPGSKLREFGGMLYAPTMSQRQIVAMEIAQTGRTVAWNAGVGIGNFRG